LNELLKLGEHRAYSNIQNSICSQNLLRVHFNVECIELVMVIRWTTVLRLYKTERWTSALCLCKTKVQYDETSTFPRYRLPGLKIVSFFLPRAWIELLLPNMCIIYNRPFEFFLKLKWTLLIIKLNFNQKLNFTWK
jgi:hypothetical protein